MFYTFQEWQAKFIIKQMAFKPENTKNLILNFNLLVEASKIFEFLLVSYGYNGRRHSRNKHSKDTLYCIAETDKTISKTSGWSFPARLHYMQSLCGKSRNFKKTTSHCLKQNLHWHYYFVHVINIQTCCEYLVFN